MCIALGQSGRSEYETCPHQIYGVMQDAERSVRDLPASGVHRVCVHVCLCFKCNIDNVKHVCLLQRYRLEYLSKSSGKLPARRKVVSAYSESLMVRKGFGSATLPPARREGCTIRSLWNFETRHQDRALSANIASRPTACSSGIHIPARKTCSAARLLQCFEGAKAAIHSSPTHLIQSCAWLP
jgi:hypothetical protein